MTKELRRRKSIRLRNYDYSQSGMYFITVCSYLREEYFGHIGENADGQSNDNMGRQVENTGGQGRPPLQGTGRYPAPPSIVGADDSVRLCIPVRPVTFEDSNVGQIIRTCWHEIDNIYENIKTDKFCIMPNHVHGIIIIGDVDEKNNDGQDSNTGKQGSPHGTGRPSLHRVVQGFKSVTTRMCFEMGYQKIWQRSFYDHIIRNENEYQQIWKYIDTNPANWEYDIFYHRNDDNDDISRMDDIMIEVIGGDE